LDPKNLSEASSICSARRYLSPMYALELKGIRTEGRGGARGERYLSYRSRFHVGCLGSWHITGGRTEIFVMKPPGPCARRKGHGICEPNQILKFQVSRSREAENRRP